ncbi:hypothetical protein B0T18DRAFT_428010 [Schizothecium vesticola]|uniref:N-acetyltransferase ESCO zinc-finger domain-containing protein n=1 Tax=Schizothecium vesticola TaxID=314040 RepID=A0AA40K8Q6_9PEZI|nr:hypothetical protein B0T18DRAFT_428010 [Schizothecium vesticola]
MSPSRMEEPRLTKPPTAVDSALHDDDLSDTPVPPPPRERKRPLRTYGKRVQMTLSLAINPGPGFTVCKDCGILYNPLNEKDRKEHKKQHAAHVRAKLREQAKGQVG